MKIGICTLAFIVGCFFTVYMKASADGSNPISEISTTAISNSSPESNRDPLPTMLDITSKPYGTTRDGKPVTLFTCTNTNGFVMEMIDYGATVTAFKMPDKNGKLENITLSCNDIAGYESCTSYFGCTVGRYCNRIKAGKFSIDGVEYKLNTNNGANHLHGGNIGFDKKIWKTEILKDDKFVGVRFKLTSENGDEGYPGKLEVTADYILTNENELVIEFKATADKKTHVNLTNHNYWNLGGQGSGKITGQLLKLEADNYIPVTGDGIPTGKIAAVKGTPFDFTDSHIIGDRFEQVGGDPIGYDHCWVLNNQTGNMALAATLTDKVSGRIMEVHTTLPGIQFYSGNFLNGQPGSGGFNQHNALCLETQRYPDSPNHSEWPSTLLEPGKEFHEKTIHKFRLSSAK